MINPAYFVAAGAIALAGVCYVGMNRAERITAEVRADCSDDKAEIARNHSKALAQQIEDFNGLMQTLKEMEKEGEKSRALIAAYAASAAAAESRSATAGRRMRDAQATVAVIASTAANQAGASPECKAAAETSRVLNSVLQDLDSLTGRISSFANTVSRFADESYIAATTCEQSYKVIR